MLGMYLRIFSVCPLRIGKELVHVSNVPVNEHTRDRSVRIAWERRVRPRREDAVVVRNLPSGVRRDHMRDGVERDHGLARVELEAVGILFQIPVRYQSCISSRNG